MHIFSDGRDSSPKQLGYLIKEFESQLPKSINIVTLVGRYFAMDRDNRWDRVKKSFDLIAYGKYTRKEDDVSTAIRKAYESNETDEFIYGLEEEIEKTTRTFKLGNKSQEHNLIDSLKIASRKFAKEKTGKKPFTNINLVKI